MLTDIKTVTAKVVTIMEQNTATRDDDTLLMLEVWKLQGLHLNREAEEWILKNCSPAESIRRVRQKIQEGGELLGTKRRHRMDEEPKVRDWAKEGLL